MTEKEFDETTLWTPANIVTLVRILLVPVFVVAIISPWPTYIPDWHNAELCKPWVAALIFAILSCTDALDGYLARSRGEVTNFGKFIDPLADKILVAAALLALIELQVLPSWVALLIIAREFIVSGENRDRHQIPARRPSRKRSTRFAMRAIAALCVTITIVQPYVRFTLSISSRTSFEVL